MEDVNVNLRYELHRSMQAARAGAGWVLKAKVPKVVEDWIKLFGDEAKKDVDGGLWAKLDGGKLQYWYAKKPLPQEEDYSFNGIGSPLVNEYGGANLSFLRLCGISEGNGIEIAIKDVIKSKDLDKIQDLLASATSRFYNDYIRSIRFIVELKEDR